MKETFEDLKNVEHAMIDVASSSHRDDDDSGAMRIPTDQEDCGIFRMNTLCFVVELSSWIGRAVKN